MMTANQNRFRLRQCRLIVIRKCSYYRLVVIRPRWLIVLPWCCVYSAYDCYSNDVKQHVKHDLFQAVCHDTARRFPKMLNKIQRKYNPRKHAKITAVMSDERPQLNRIACFQLVGLNGTSYNLFVGPVSL